MTPEEMTALYHEGLAWPVIAARAGISVSAAREATRALRMMPPPAGKHAEPAPPPSVKKYRIADLFSWRRDRVRP